MVQSTMARHYSSVQQALGHSMRGAKPVPILVEPTSALVVCCALARCRINTVRVTSDSPVLEFFTKGLGFGGRKRVSRSLSEKVSHMAQPRAL